MIRSDKRIKLDIMDQLASDTRVNVGQVRVSVNSDGEVKLRGTVPYLEAKNAAERAAWKILGVSDVQNKIEVSYSDSIRVPLGEELKKQAEKVIRWNPVVDVESINVGLKDNGIIVLTGSVDVYWKKISIQELISQMRGVREVVNKLSIVPSKKRKDEEIAKDITSALDRNISADVKSIDLVVRGGEVILNGVVSSAIARDAAVEAAESTAGVTEIRNNLSIRY